MIMNKHRNVSGFLCADFISFHCIGQSGALNYVVILFLAFGEKCMFIFSISTLMTNLTSSVTALPCPHPHQHALFFSHFYDSLQLR